ncbi:MAG: DUF3341 domain-containing protein [Bacteroidia bacterium]|nr:DUF3341 domain-containing protein [Bacteroidia bacterium]
MDKRIINAIYGDDDHVLKSARTLRSSNIQVKEVFSPFPIHGIEAVLGVKKTRLATCAFLYGITGMLLGTLMMWYMMVGDWPNIIGGKPNWFYFQNIPAFIPITFECTVLCAAHGMALTYFLRSWLLPGVTPTNPDPRTTDDKFCIQVLADDAEVPGIVSKMKADGAEEVTVS